ncbi:MAG: hypothetical protein KGR26_00275 [Cyanobacteria bacterium REEB65]|nr:hypothetical protein [Cyanobacteria bacterium REEB65]
MSRARALPWPIVLAMAIVAGCQASSWPWSPAATAPEAASLAPGRLDITVQAARQVQALDPMVASVRFSLSGPNVPAATAPLTVPSSAFVNGKAIAHWDQLLPGAVSVQVQVFDSAGNELAHGDGSATIAAGQTANLILTVQPDTGSLTLSTDLGGIAAATPSLILSFGSVPPQSWQEAPPLAIAHTDPSAVQLDGTLFLVGGDFDSEVEAFDPADQTWQPLVMAPNATIKSLLGHAAALGGQIAVVGRDVEAIGEAEDSSPLFLDPFAAAGLRAEPAPSRAPDYLADLAAPRTAAGVVSDGQTLYMIGGTSRRSVDHQLSYVYVTLNLVEALSASTLQWSLKAPMPTSRGSLGVAMTGGKIFAAGGFQWTGSAQNDPILNQLGVAAAGAQLQPLANLECYDAATDSWSELAAMPTPRYGVAVVAAGGRIYAIGGTTGTAAAVGTVESYDPATNTWRSDPALPIARSLAAATVIGDQILVAGGVGADGRPLRSVEVFNTEPLP